jgi:hypothetical protein
MFTQLPRAYKGGSFVEVKKPNTDTILSVYDKAESGKTYNAMLSLVEGSIENIDGRKPTIEDIRTMPIVSAEYVIIEAFKKYKLPTKVEGVYPCPRCGTKIICEHNKQEDTRDDIVELPIIYDRFNEFMKPNHTGEYDYKQDYFKLELSDDEKLQFGDDTFIHSITFRDPTLEDLVKIQADATLQTSSSRQKKLYTMCIVDIEFMHPTIDNWEDIKKRYLYELVRFDDYRTFDKITVGLRRFGFYPFKERGCHNCKKVWESAVDFTSFFVSALRSNLGSQVR